MKIAVVSIGPGDPRLIPPMAEEALREAEVVIGYGYYIELVRGLLKEEQECIAKAIGSEGERAELAFEHAEAGRSVAVISSGDAGIYAMGSLIYEEAARRDFQGELTTIPGVTAFTAAAARVGAPIGHDLCCISLSDRLTPWETIEGRIRSAAKGDFVTALYNPRSEKRYWQLDRFRELFLQERSPETPVAIVRQVHRPEERIERCSLEKLDSDRVDMFSLVLVGNSQTYRYGDKLITPRGYHDGTASEQGDAIQSRSFAHILQSLKQPERPIDELWALIRCIHSTGDPSYEEAFESTPGAIEKWASALKEGTPIVTDVEMVRSGISPKLREKYGSEVLCYLNEAEIPDIAADKGITRSKAAMQRALEEHPEALFVVGNAPTALNAIADAIELEGLAPAGVIGAPVGFVNVEASKQRLKASRRTPYVLIAGTRGGSNVAASIANAALTLDGAEKALKNANAENRSKAW